MCAIIMGEQDAPHIRSTLAREEDMRTLVFILVLSLFPAFARADVKVDSVTIVEKGIYTIDTGDETRDAQTPTGKITAVTKVRNIESTVTIPARLGLEFGFQYVVVGDPAGAEVTLDIVTTFPAQGLRNPKASKPLYESKYRRTKKIGDTVYLGYGFENLWEVEPGIWTFQIWHENRKLAEQSFTVVK
jgi:hypothetical protein